MQAHQKQGPTRTPEVPCERARRYSMLTSGRSTANKNLGSKLGVRPWLRFIARGCEDLCPARGTLFIWRKSAALRLVVTSLANKGGHLPGG